MEQQTDLFSVTAPIPTAVPEGFAMARNVLSEDQEAGLVQTLEGLPLKPYVFQGHLANRRVVGFGYRYYEGKRAAVPAEPMPAFLVKIRDQVANAMGLDRELFVQVLVNEYRPGAGIGWHKDRPGWGEVMALSLSSPCSLRLRRQAEKGWDRIAVDLPRRSAYLLSGPARSEWEHSIVPMTDLRYSVTFRTLADGQAASTSRPTVAL